MEVLLNTKVLEGADQLPEELENTVDVGQLPFPSPHASFIPQPSPGPQVAHLPPHIPPKGPPLSPPDPVQQLVQALMAIGQNIHQPPPAPVPQTNSQTWVHPPNTFDGSNLEDLRTFLLQCQIMFNSYPQQYSSHTAKVCFAISYLKKAALEWFKQGIIEDDPRLVPAWKLSWPEFINELRTYF